MSFPITEMIQYYEDFGTVTINPQEVVKVR